MTMNLFDGDAELRREDLAAGAFVEAPQNFAAKSTTSSLRAFASRAIGLCFLFAYA